MLIHMFHDNRLRGLLLLFPLFACGCSEESEPATRLGDSWSGESAVGDYSEPWVSSDAPKVIFLGDSLSAGLHLDADQAFPAVLQRRLIEAELPFDLVNAGVSGDTTAGGLSRIDWLLEQAPEIVVVELGGNDGLRGLAVQEIEDNLRSILQRIKDAGATPILLGMRIPTNYGVEYADSFRAIYERLADELEVPSVLDFLAGVGGVRELNLPDGIHPNSRGHELLADNIESVIRSQVRIRR